MRSARARSAPGPSRNPLRSTQCAGRVAGVPPLPSLTSPVRFAPLRFRPASVDSPNDAPDRFAWARSANAGPARRPDRFPPGQAQAIGEAGQVHPVQEGARATRYPLTRRQSTGRLTGAPRDPPTADQAEVGVREVCTAKSAPLSSAASRSVPVRFAPAERSASLRLAQNKSSPARLAPARSACVDLPVRPIRYRVRDLVSGWEAGRYSGNTAGHVIGKDCHAVQLCARNVAISEYRLGHRRVRHIDVREVRPGEVH